MAQHKNIGVDPQELRDLGTHFQHASADIQQLAADLQHATAGLDTGAWTGDESARLNARFAEAEVMGQRRAAAHAELGDLLLRAADEFERADRAPQELAATEVFNSTVMSDLHFPLDLLEPRPVPDPYPYPFASFSSEPPDGLIEFLLEPIRHLLPNFKVSTGEDSITLRFNTLLFDRELEVGWKEHATARTGSPVTVSPSAIRLAEIETFWVERDFLRDVWTMAFISACTEHRLAEDITVQTRTQIVNSVNITDQPGVIRSALSMEIPFMFTSENSSYTATPYMRYSQNANLRRASALATDAVIVVTMSKLGPVIIAGGVPVLQPAW